LSPVRALGYFAAVILVILGLIFLMASTYAASRLFVGGILIAVGFGTAILARRPRSVQGPVKVEIEVPGSLKVESVKCTNCGASLDSSKMVLKQGVPTLRCPYCDKEFEVTEAPRW
jgi:membrane-bound ClpP family serine protease